MKKVYHLSHIDLDGYSAQLVTSRCFEDIEFFNSNYGIEIDERIGEIAKRLEEEQKIKSLVLVSDLNLTLSQCSLFEDLALKYENVEILLLDHHISGQECANKYEWYHLDEHRCATKIVYDYFKNMHNIEELEIFVDVVNSVDIWLHESPYFELGKTLSSFVDGCREINKIQFPKENSNYIRYILNAAMEYIGNSNKAHIVLDEKVHFIKKSFFKEGNDNTLANLVSAYLVELLAENKDRFTLYHDGYKGIVTYSILSSSIIGNDFLVKNDDYDFFINVTTRNYVSLRANGKVDVAAMSKKLFGGGGHRNASGGKLQDFKSSFVFDKIFEQLKNIMV